MQLSRRRLPAPRRRAPPSPRARLRAPAPARSRSPGPCWRRTPAPICPQYPDPYNAHCRDWKSRRMIRSVASFAHRLRACRLRASGWRRAAPRPAGEPAGPRRAPPSCASRPATSGTQPRPSLPAQAAVTRTGERQGPWVRVRTEAGATGWVHLFDVGPASAATAGGSAAGGALRGVTGLFGRRPSTHHDRARPRSASAAWAPRTWHRPSPTRPP